MKQNLAIFLMLFYEFGYNSHELHWRQNVFFRAEVTMLGNAGVV
jgi:hypothetical protein